jgi:hypothetical protein
MNSKRTPIGIIIGDFGMLLAGGLAVLLLLLIFHINKPGELARGDLEVQPSVIVEITWPHEWNTDVDLWVQAPGDVPVGYSNKGGVIFNLLRDDLGRRGDPTNINYEIAFSRGIPPGEYTVNVHLYRNAERTLPVPVSAVVSVKPTPQSQARQILSSSVNLTRVGQELTVFRFNLDAEGALVPGSVHALPKSIRNWRPGQ